MGRLSGRVTTLERDPAKIALAPANLATANLATAVDILEGSAADTLPSLPAPLPTIFFHKLSRFPRRCRRHRVGIAQRAAPKSKMLDDSGTCSSNDLEKSKPESETIDHWSRGMTTPPAFTLSMPPQ